MNFLILYVITLPLVYGKSSELHHLNETNWDVLLKGQWMVEFYAPWCPACKAIQKTWEEFATLGNELSISVGQIDVTKSPGLSGRFMVTALPTIYHIHDRKFRQYRGSRDKVSFLKFIKNKDWQEIQPLPDWKAPDSIQMSTVAYFFKLSQILRNIHTKLMEDYGLPTWGSYLIFAVGTILVGACIGLIVVFVIDFMFPARIPPKRAKKEEKNSEGEEETDDDVEIKDELIDETESASTPTKKKRKVL